MEDTPPVISRGEIVKEYVIAPASNKASSTDMAIASPLSQPIAAPAPTAYKPNELGMKLMQAKDLKAFIIDALKHPEKGGAWYAHEALKQCDSWEYNKAENDAAVQKVIATKSTISSEQLAQMKDIETRCGGLLEADRDALEAEMNRIALTKRSRPADENHAGTRPETTREHRRVGEHGP